MTAIGTMRLSTAADRDEARGIAVITAALDAGAVLIDTADAYAHDDRETGHNERLVAAALAQWGGDRSRIEVATKGGLTRPRGAWVPDGRARHLREACEASCRNLGVDSIDLYQLHAVDPRVPFETSVRALASLRAAGRVKHIGLCNVTVGQIEAARRIVDVHSVQVSLSPFDDDNLRNGVAEYCRDHGIRLLAWRPLGGERVARLAKDPLLASLAQEYGATAAEIALAWLASFGNVVPLAGPTQVAHATSIGRAATIELSPVARQQLDARFNGRLLRVPRADRRAKATGDGEVVVLMGMPGAGKSTIVREFERDGYSRLNRDATGGTLAALVKALDAGIAGGTRRWVLDNTYPTRAARNDVIECAWQHGLPVRCVWLTTPVADAQRNAITRLLDVHGHLPMPEDLKRLGRSDPRYLGPDAQFRYERALEPPVPDEGFVAVESRAFVREVDASRTARALCLELDDVVWEGAPLRPEDITLLPGRREMLQQRHAEGWLLFAQGWRPQVARGTVSRDDLRRCAEHLSHLIGVDVPVAWCVHDAGPPICWCRKPLPGLVLEFTWPRRVDLTASLMVGRASADRTLAERLGMPFEDGTTFFAAPGAP